MPAVIYLGSAVRTGSCTYCTKLIVLCSSEDRRLVVNLAEFIVVHSIHLNVLVDFGELCTAAQ